MGGKLTLRELAFYGWQYLHHVAAFPTYLTALHARLPEGATRRAVLQNAVDEEVDGVSHANLWRQFIGGMEAVQRTESEETLPEIQQLVKTYQTMANGDSLPTVLGAFYAYKSQVPRIAETKLAGLKQFYGEPAILPANISLYMRLPTSTMPGFGGSSSITACTRILPVPQRWKTASVAERNHCGVRSTALKPHAMVLFQ